MFNIPSERYIECWMTASARNRPVNTGKRVKVNQLITYIQIKLLQGLEFDEDALSQVVGSFGYL